MTLKNFLLAGSCILVLACGRKTVPSATEVDYHEDLSGTLPEVEKYESPVKKKTRVEKTDFKEPYMDITSGLDTMLDTLAIVNQDIPNLQYTILIHNSNSRQAADEARKNVFRVLPDANPIMQFVSPSYHVKVGSYIDKIEAYKTLVKLQDMFPNAVIIPEQVYFK
ncbi:MAG: hypothetical protein KFF73_01300 [Cyclobacteriaceae bacterium]|nr:hypothetical protein [Cyclobacteriaceae bacterium]